MKSNVFVKILTVILATTMFISGSFLMSNDDDNVVHADGNWVTILSNGIQFGNDVVPYIAYGTDSVAYEMPYYIKDLATNVSSLGQNSNLEQAAKLWYDMVITGKQNAQNWQSIQQLCNYGERGLSTYVSSGMDLVAKSIASGGGNSKTSTLSKILMGATVISGVASAITIGEKLSQWLGNKDNAMPESSNRNYYTETTNNTNNYNTGTTKYYQVTNNQQRQFYNTYNNRYETINNYTYDINENYYTYNTTYNNYNYEYKITNNYNNTYIFNTNGNYDYSLYYRLPDGSNSFNLTEDDIEGIRTDFTVDNYEVNNANGDLLGLYHLNGNNLNAYDLENDEIFVANASYFPFNSNNYVDSLLGFDLGYMSTSYYLFKLADNDIKNIRFYLNVNYNSSSSSPLWHQSNATVNTIDYITDSGGTGSVSLLNNNSFNLYEFSYEDGYWYYYVNGVKTYKLAYNLTRNDFTQSIHDSYFNVNYNLTTFTEYDSYYYLKYVCENSSYADQIKRVAKFNINNLFYLSSSNFNYYILDELRISTNSYSNHDVNYLPYADGIYYTLPNSDTNNKLLIQSDIAVNNWQFGGVRESYNNSIKGDVYIYLVDNKITQIQQFDGHDWITKEGAIYSEYLGKWVNAIGYSILLNNWDYSDVTANDVKDVTTMSQWLSGVLNDIKTAIVNGFNTVNLKLDNLLNGGSSDSDSNQDVLDKFDEVQEAQQSLEDENIFDFESQVADDIDDITSLSSITTGLFDVVDDNNLQILYVAPMIVLLLRLII